MELPLAYYGDPILRKKTSPVTHIDDQIRRLIDDMTETMRKNDGIGIAAPQVHQSLAICIVCPPVIVGEGEDRKIIEGTPRVFINPKLSNPSEHITSYSEGCLSIPKLHAEIIRPASITVEAMDINGNIFTEELFGMEARILMHENDHLNGVLFIDRIQGKKRQALEPQLQQIKKKYSKNKPK